MKRTEEIKIVDDHGFSHEVTLEHFPHFGFSNALYRGIVINQVSLGRITAPISDDDREWEMYEERFSEWTDEIKENMESGCKLFFNRNDS